MAQWLPAGCGGKPVYRQGGSGKRSNGCKPAANDYSPDIGGFDGGLRFVPVTAFIAFIWQGGAGCDEGVPYLPGPFGAVPQYGEDKVHNEYFHCHEHGQCHYNKKLLRMTYIGSAAWNFLIVLLTPFVLMLYSLSKDTRNLVMLLVVIHSVFNVILCPVAFSLSNGLRAAGDIRFTMYAPIFATVVCRVVFYVVFGVWMNLGVIGICLAMVGVSGDRLNNCYRKQFFI